MSLRSGLSAVRLELPARAGGLLRVTHAVHQANPMAAANALRTFHTLTRPEVPDAELIGALRWKLVPNLDYPPEQALLQVMELPALSDNPRRKLLAVKARSLHAELERAQTQRIESQ